MGFNIWISVTTCLICVYKTLLSYMYICGFIPAAFIQKNVIYGTVRKVCRRPKYVSPQDVKMKQTW